MKALVLDGPGRLTLKEVPEPEAADDEVLVSVAIAGLGGSETLALANPGVRPLPNIMGHGICGTTNDGRRVGIYPLIGCGICRYCERDEMQLCDEWILIGVQRSGGFAERVVAPADSLVEIPDELSWEQSAFIEPFANSISAWDKAAIGPRDHVLVIGAGGLGLGLVAQGVAGNLEHVVEVIDPADTRLDAAQRIGAARCDDSPTRRYDVVFDTVGSTESRSLALRLADKGGTVVLLGFAAASMTLAANEFIRHEQRLVGSFVYDTAQFRQAVELARCIPDDFVTNLGWDDVQKALAGFQHGDHRMVKAALRP